MASMQDRITVSGAGPAGLAAAITAARAGVPAVVYERHEAVGHRFHGDLQGIENWTTEGDRLEELAALGIEPSFDCTPFYETVLYDPDGREHLYRDTRPLFYLVHRGPGEGSLDRGLQQQALSLGVDLRFGATPGQSPRADIVATGPQRADVIAVGYLFETDASDGAFCALSGQLSSQGYAYLIVHRGRGVIATCLFADFHNDRYYLERSMEFFQREIGLTMRHLRLFGGAGNYSFPRTARKGGVLYAGECAGFQDAMAGFGIRYALLSGSLAARTLLAGKPEAYDDLWRDYFGGELRASVVNRFFYARLGDIARGILVRHFAGTSNVRARLRRRYARSGLKDLFYPIAKRSVERRLELKTASPDPRCDCTRCRCGETESPTLAEPRRAPSR